MAGDEEEDRGLMSDGGDSIPDVTFSEYDTGSDASLHKPYSTSNSLNDQAWSLYLSHLITVFGTQSYGAIALSFLRATYPDNTAKYTLALSIIQTLLTVPFLIPLGSWIDTSTSRINPLIWSIVVNRAAIVTSCVLCPMMLIPWDSAAQSFYVVTLAILGAVVNASSALHTLIIERSWIPILAAAQASTPTRTDTSTYLTRYYGLTGLNVTLRGINIVSALVAPAATRAFIRATELTLAALLIAVAISPCMAIEAWCARRAWRCSDALSARRGEGEEDNKDEEVHMRSSKWLAGRFINQMVSMGRWLCTSNIAGLQHYLSTDVWIPSLCLVLTHASLISLSGEFFASLSDTGISSGRLGLVNMMGYTLAFIGTLVFLRGVAPLGQRFTGSSRTRGESYQMVQQGEVEATEDEEVSAPDIDEVDGLDGEEKYGSPNSDCGHVLGNTSLHAGTVKMSRFSMAFYTVALLLSTFALLCYTGLSSRTTTASVTSNVSFTTITAFLLCSFFVLSQLGHGAFDISVLQLTQMLVPTWRAEFGGAEQALIGCISLFRWAGLAVWWTQSQFTWMALGGGFAVAFAGVVVWVWTRTWIARH